MPDQANTQEDLTLFSRVREGDEVAFKEIFYKYFGMLTATAERMVGDHDTGKEVAQKVMLVLWEKRESISISGSLAGYLKRMAINDSLAMSRNEARRLDIRSGMDLPKTEMRNAEDEMESSELRAAVDTAINRLPDKCREVFKLSRYEELTYKEISEALDISPKTVENHIGRALRELRGALRKYVSIFL